MFLELPAITFLQEDEDESTFTPSRFEVYINPIHVISIEPDTRNTCFIVMTMDVSYKITLSRAKLKVLLEDFIKQNILTKIYKDIKEQGN